jgi:hypothetical protein
MPIPVKPCEGKLSEATKQLLRKSRDRAQWSTHPCEVCGQSVGVVPAGADWIPERHWPSVSYVRKSAPKPRSHAAAAAQPASATSAD